jgi:hypothetical protein
VSIELTFFNLCWSSFTLTSFLRTQDVIHVTIKAQQATSNEQRATSNKQHATSNKQRATSNKQHPTHIKQQAASNKQHARYDNDSTQQSLPMLIAHCAWCLLGNGDVREREREREETEERKRGGDSPPLFELRVLRGKKKLGRFAV